MNWVIGIFGTLAIAVIGNALWDALKPPLFSVSGKLFTLLSLNAQRSKDRIFFEAARGERERNSSFASTFIAVFFFAINFTAAMFGTTIGVINLSFELEEGSPQISVRDLVRHNMPDDIISWTLIISSLMLAVLSYRYVYRALFLNRADIVVSWFNQCITILAPCISDEQEKNYKQAFAQMKTEEGFNILRVALVSTAKQHEIELPEVDAPLI